MLQGRFVGINDIDVAGNGIANLSGLTGSMITAVAENLTGNINNGTYVLALCLLVSGGLILAIPKSMIDKPA